MRPLLFLCALTGVLVTAPQPAVLAQTIKSDEHDFRVVKIVEGLAHPWGLAFLPDGRLLVTERSGRLRVVKDGRLEPQPVSGVPQVAVHGQGGLLDVALHPRYAENNLLYLSYAARGADGVGTEVWVPSIAPSGMAFYDGDKFPRWRGDLFVGALRDQMLVRLRLEGEKVVREERLLKNRLGRIRDVRSGPDGLIYLLTDESAGVLVRLEPTS